MRDAFDIVTDVPFYPATFLTVDTLAYGVGAVALGLVTLLGDAAHPMYPVGSNGAAQAIIDGRVLARALSGHPSVAAALRAYEAERLPATTRLVLSNRQMGPERVIDLVAARAPDGFGELEQVISQAELEDIARQYRQVAGFARGNQAAGRN